MQKLIVIVGPTSSGKTKLAVELARKFNGEIVSADSRQVYRGMDIGTGKELRAYGVGRRAVKHHLIDVVSPRTNFTLAQYQKLVYRAIEDIFRRSKVPILVGGTGLYVQAVVDGYVLPQAPPDFKLRARLERMSTRKLCSKLIKLDSATYRTIDTHNRRRLERAIEICVGTGVPLSEQRKKQAPPYGILMLGLGPRYTYPRSRISVTGNYANAMLYRRIDQRLKERLKQGMIEEVARLHRQGVSWKRLESFGLEYRYVSQYLRNVRKISIAKLDDRQVLRYGAVKTANSRYNKMVQDLSRAIKDFSRRQMTWFKRDKRIVWVRNKKQAAQLARLFLRG